MYIIPLLLFYNEYYLISQGLLINIILFPLKLWLVEVFEYFCLIFIFGKTIEWKYNGVLDHIYGNLKIKYLLCWVVTDVLFEWLCSKFLKR